MLSGLTSKLRERAKALRQGHWSDGHDDALLMEDAADIIDTLRDMNNDLSRGNKKLRDLLRKLYRCSRQIGCDKCSCSVVCETVDCFCETIGSLHDLGVRVDE